MQVELEQPGSAAVWAAVGNIKDPCMIGPYGGRARAGTKHVRAGAKVYVIDAHRGAPHAVTAVGRHRKGRRFIPVDMPAKHIENLRAKLIYGPAVVRLTRAHYGATRPPPDAAMAAQLCRVAAWGN